MTATAGRGQNCRCRRPQRWLSRGRRCGPQATILNATASDAALSHGPIRSGRRKVMSRGGRWVARPIPTYRRDAFFIVSDRKLTILHRMYLV